jgi:hypothetical protein
LTIVVTLSDGRDILSISDGMVSRPTAKSQGIVLSQVQKFVAIRPCIKVPQVRMGRVDSIKLSHMGEMYLAFAGNYSSITSIATEFSSIVTSQLFAKRDMGLEKTVVYRDKTLQPFQTGDRAFEEADEAKFPWEPFGVWQLTEILEDVVRKHSADFALNQADNPDVEMQLIGRANSIISSTELICKQVLPSENHTSGLSFSPDVHVVKKMVAPYELSTLGNRKLGDELKAKFKDRLQTCAVLAAECKEQDMFDASPGSHSLLAESYRDLAKDIVADVREIIAKNARGVGGEMKILRYVPTFGFSLRFENPE